MSNLDARLKKLESRVMLKDEANKQIIIDVVKPGPNGPEHVRRLYRMPDGTYAEAAS